MAPSCEPSWVYAFLISHIRSRDNNEPRDSRITAVSIAVTLKNSKRRLIFSDVSLEIDASSNAENGSSSPA